METMLNGLGTVGHNVWFNNNNNPFYSKASFITPKDAVHKWNHPRGQKHEALKVNKATRATGRSGTEAGLVTSGWNTGAVNPLFQHRVYLKTFVNLNAVSVAWAALSSPLLSSNLCDDRSPPHPLAALLSPWGSTRRLSRYRGRIKCDLPVPARDKSEQRSGSTAPPGTASCPPRGTRDRLTCFYCIFLLYFSRASPLGGTPEGPAPAFTQQRKCKSTFYTPSWTGPTTQTPFHQTGSCSSFRKKRERWTSWAGSVHFSCGGVLNSAAFLMV